MAYKEWRDGVFTAWAKGTGGRYAMAVDGSLDPRNNGDIDFYIIFRKWLLGAGGFYTKYAQEDLPVPSLNFN